jgi:hypothetical protein
MINETIKDAVRICRGNARVFLFFSAICLSLFAADFFSRVFVRPQSSNKHYSPPVVQPINLGVSESEISFLLDELFKLPEPEQNAPPPRDIILEAVFGREKALRAVVALRGEALPTERRLVNVGDNVEGWTVAAVQARKVNLTKEGEVREITIFPSKPN